MQRSIIGLAAVLAPGPVLAGWSGAYVGAPADAEFWPRSVRPIACL